MSRKKIIEMLESHVAQVQEYANEPATHDFHFWAHCHLPEWLDHITEELLPWYVKAWRSTVYWFQRIRQWPDYGFDDEIPF